MVEIEKPHDRGVAEGLEKGVAYGWVLGGEDEINRKSIYPLYILTLFDRVKTQDGGKN